MKSVISFFMTRGIYWSVLIPDGIEDQNSIGLKQALLVDSLALHCSI